MHHVYLLLRNNQQTGPYTLEQLLQLQLKPFDLVWVEGRTAAWQYPGEVPSLKPYVAATPSAEQPYMPVPTAVMDEAATVIPQPAAAPAAVEAAPPPQAAAATSVTSAAATPAKKIFVSMPQGAAAKPVAQPVPEPAPMPVQQAAPVAPAVPKQPEPQAAPSWHQAYQPSPAATTQTQAAPTATVNTAAAAAKATTTGETRYARSMEEMEEAYSNWMVEHKTKKKKSISAKDLGVVAALLAIIGGGYYLLSKPALTATHLPTAQAAVTATPVQEQPVTEPAADPNTTTPAPVETQSQQAAANNSGVITTASTHSAAATPQRPQAHKTVTTTGTQAVTASAPVGTPRNAAPQETSAPAPIPRTTSAPAPTSEDRQDGQKKKKLRDVFKDIFKGKDKGTTTSTNTPAEPTRSSKPAPVTEEPRPATGRQAARRGAEESPAGTSTNTGAAPATENAAALADQVDIFSNAPDDWMMGVSNLKVTLRNRSASALQSASVEVLYYDQNNKLLDRKTLNFGNVPARGRQTLAAPDNKWADHVDYKLQNISAKDDRYARG